MATKLSSAPPVEETTNTLANMRRNQSGIVCGLKGEPALCRRLAEMGLVPGVEVRVEQKALFGGPVQICVRGYKLGLRADQAACIQMKSESPICAPSCGASCQNIPTFNRASPVSSSPAVGLSKNPIIALVGNPNAGKTTLFNALTGMHQVVGNYPGVTVEHREGPLPLGDGQMGLLLDLPGLYSLIPASLDECITLEVLCGIRHGVSIPDRILAVVDSTNLSRNLLLITQLLEAGLPMVIALTMVDEARKWNLQIDPVGLSHMLGVKVVPVVASTGEGLMDLCSALREPLKPSQPLPWAQQTGNYTSLTEVLSKCLHRSLPPEQTRLIAWALFSKGYFSGSQVPDICITEANHVCSCLTSAEHLDILVRDTIYRYAWIDGSLTQLNGKVYASGVTPKGIDSVLLHPVWGLVIFGLAMLTFFVSIFVVAAPAMDLAEEAVELVGDLVASKLSEGLWQDLWVHGIVAGLAPVIKFVPQIACTFVLLAILDGSGYLARGAFLLDRLLSALGLHGRSFVPLLSAHACALPGIMAARTIPDAQDRLATMLIVPFMACPARLPVYGLVIRMFFSNLYPWQQGFIFAGLYVTGIVAAAITAWILRVTALSGHGASFMIELPTYRWPDKFEILRSTWQGVQAFLFRAGTIILVMSVVMWTASTFPRLDTTTTSVIAQQYGTTFHAIASGTAPGSAVTALQQAQLEHSVAGRIGLMIEPIIAPAGMDWRIGIGLFGAFTAREVFVSTLGVVYGAGTEGHLEDFLLQARRPDGTPQWTPLLSVAVLAWFVLAMQCLSTFAVMVREANSWRWALIQLVGMNALAWVVAVSIWQIGCAVGLK